MQHFKEVYPLVGRPFVGPVAVEAHDGTVVLQIIQIDAQHFLEIGRWRAGHYIFQRNALQGSEIQAFCYGWEALCQPCRYCRDLQIFSTAASAASFAEGSKLTISPLQYET